MKLPFLWLATSRVAEPLQQQPTKQASQPLFTAQDSNDRTTFSRFFYLFNPLSFAQPRHNLVCKVKDTTKEVILSTICNGCM